ncbi:hypothetical protein vnz_36320 [Streptomyces venezuelae]|nr:hypothetical protein vnz_36320 [Streptomyces venezuelae]
MVGPGVEVLPDAADDGVRVAVRDDRVHQPPARAADEVRVAEAEAPHAGLLVRGGRDVSGDMGRGHLPCPVDVGVQDDGLLDPEERLRPQDPPGQLRVFHGHEVRMGAPGACGGELQHLRAEGGQDPARRRVRHRTVGR